MANRRVHSHRAQALTYEVCRRGFDMVLTNDHTMPRHLHAGQAENTHKKHLALTVRPELLVLDDFGLKLLAAISIADLCDVNDVRYVLQSARSCSPATVGQ